MPITKAQDRQIKIYCKKRDAMLMHRDVDKLIAFKVQHKIPLCSTRQVEEIGMHKAITAVRALPLKFRQQSKKWLIARGYSSLDDGDL